MPRVSKLVAKALLIGALLATASTAASTAAAQTAPGPSRAAGLRVLTWPGKVERTPVVAAPARAPLRGPIAVYAQRPTPVPEAAAPSRGLTPASAWLAPAGPPLAAPPPVSAQGAEIATAPTFSSPPSGRRQDAQRPEGGDAAPADPMAPRRDAAIFRMGAAATPPPPAASPAVSAQVAETSTASATQGARFYSVHRADGRQPDPIPLPAPFFLDAAPVDMAEPPAQPTLVRNGNGRVQAAPLVDEPTLP